LAQKLILPINRCKLTASMRTAAYLSRYGYNHYGADMVSTAGAPNVYAGGNGTVVAAGWDNVVGNVVAVRYNGAQNHATGEEADLILRYFHLASISVRSGQAVDKDTVLGRYGCTGMLAMAPHLHLEADTDVAYPLYSPTVRSSNLIRGTARGAHDRTVRHPMEFLHCKPGAPDRQTYATAENAYIRGADKRIPCV